MILKKENKMEQSVYVQLCLILMFLLSPKTYASSAASSGLMTKGATAAMSAKTKAKRNIFALINFSFADKKGIFSKYLLVSTVS